MAKAVAFALIAAAPTADAAVIKNSAFLDQQMRPDVVAKTLASVETEWKQQAAVFTECKQGDCSAAHKSFDKSCATVVEAIVQGSSGDRHKATEYMSNVCQQGVLAPWQKLRCSDLASAVVDHAMSADNYANRNSLNPARVCTGFWSKFVDEERKREAVEAKEKAEREAKEAKERAEREAREAKEAAEAKKKAEEEAKKEAARKAEEEARKAKQEAEEKSRREAQEAKDRAEEAAKRLAEKKAEAEKMRLEAELKAEEAKRQMIIEEERRRLLKEHGMPLKDFLPKYTCETDEDFDMVFKNRDHTRGYAYPLTAR